MNSMMFIWPKTKNVQQSALIHFVFGGKVMQNLTCSQQEFHHIRGVRLP